MLGMPIKVCNTDQACALGAAMFAATAAGAYATVADAQDAMNSGFARNTSQSLTRSRFTMRFTSVISSLVHIARK